MAFWVTRESRPFIALAIFSMGLVACSSPAPTAPSSASPIGAAPGAEMASTSSTSVTTAAADLSAATTIKITQGTLALQSLRPGTVALRGSHGFRFDGYMQSGDEPSNYCGPFYPCFPGASVTFRAAWVNTDIPGTVRLQGDEFRIGSGADASSLYIELTGSFVAPAHLTDTASVTVPFTATGLLSRDYPFSPRQLIGDGTVTFTLQWQTFFDGWAIRFTSFDFGGGQGPKG
jgi:hypothetical protein